ncbi:Cysteine protease family C48 [Phytophthora palmivora]|uniref:Cysteine protease family C48 n=1 Tax=Phytophthora palmivora TaxID=4796 RepID=A0A2P4X709_9STRA|nr:Cysteine protease family C48 [Phytophthora palmivora]
MDKFGEMDSYEEAQGLLAVITERSLPKTKKAIAGKFNEDDCEADIRYVFPQVFVKKALSAIRVFLKSIGDEVSGDVVGVAHRYGVRDRYKTGYRLGPKYKHQADWNPNGTSRKQAIDWVQNTNIKRIGIPMELQDGVSDIPADREAMIKRIPLRRSRSTPFGGLPYRELLSFCENKWVNDGAMSHGITLLQREHDGVGIVNPLFHRLSDRAARVTAVSVGNPFQEGHHLILVPLHLEDSHWCGAVIDLRSDSRGITIFDPLQAKKDKYYAACKTTLKDLYGELYEILHVKLETKCRQPDASSCGVAVLMFFECILRGVALPTTPSQSFMRFMRMRYLLKGIL